MIDARISGTRPKTPSNQEIYSALVATFQSTKRTPNGGVAIVFVSDAKMRALNRKWRGKNSSTDVLSFAPPEVPVSNGSVREWGDIFISSSYVRAEARRRNIAFREEVLRMVVHGMLHLMGYDHATADEEHKMFGIQERVIQRVLNSL